MKKYKSINLEETDYQLIKDYCNANALTMSKGIAMILKQEIKDTTNGHMEK